MVFTRKSIRICQPAVLVCRRFFFVDRASVLCSHAPSDIQQLVIESYPPGNQHIPPWEKENHLQNAIFWGYVSSLEGIFKAYYGCHKFTRCRKLIGVEPPWLDAQGWESMRYRKSGTATGALSVQDPRIEKFAFFSTWASFWKRIPLWTWNIYYYVFVSN